MIHLSTWYFLCYLRGIVLLFHHSPLSSPSESKSKNPPGVVGVGLAAVADDGDMATAVTTARGDAGWTFDPDAHSSQREATGGVPGGTESRPRVQVCV